MKYLLFDIDGTLLDSGGAGVRALNTAFGAMFGQSNVFSAIPLAGKTDKQILREGLTLHGIQYSDRTAADFFGLYVSHLSAEIKKSRGEVKPGIPRVLEALQCEELHVLGLLTGNIREGAGIKLRNFGLDTFFEAGAFGSDAENRNDLLPVALDNLYREKSLVVEYRDCVVIGDTPRDIDCAKAYGAVSIAVATGPYTSAELTQAGADIVLEDLSDTEAFLSLLA